MVDVGLDILLCSASALTISENIVTDHDGILYLISIIDLVIFWNLIALEIAANFSLTGS